VATVLDGFAGALARIEEMLVAMFAESPLTIDGSGDFSFDVRASWPTQAASQRSPSGIKSAASGIYTSLRGAQSGIILVGVFSGIAGLGLGTLAIAGIGLAFGGKQLLDERQRRLQSQRQQMRSALQRYLGDIQTEAGQALRELGREELRRIRDLLTERSNAFLAARVEREKQLTAEREQSREERRAQAGTLVVVRQQLTDLFASFEAGDGKSSQD
jgi:hypothetical protein